MVRTQSAALLALALLASPSMHLSSAAPRRTDRSGDPLPDGAVKRFGSTRLRHLRPVQALAWSPDSKLIASSGQEGVVCLWDAATGRLVRSQGMACSLAFTPDGKGLAVGLDARVCIWEVATGKELQSFDALPQKVRQLAERRRQFRVPGGDIVDGVIYDERWNPATTSLAFSPDGRRLAAAGVHSTLVWDLVKKQPCFTLTDRHDHVAFTPDGRQLITTDNARSVRLWDARTGKKLGGFETEGPKGYVNIFGFALSPDGKHAALKLLEHLVIVKLDSGKVVWRQKSHGYTEEPVAFSPDGRLLAFASKEGARIWDWAAGREIESLGQRASRAVFSPDGKRLAWAADGCIHLWDLARRKESPLLERCQSGDLFALRPDGKAFLAGNKLWDTASARVLRELELPVAAPRCLAFSRDGRTLFLGDYDSTITAVDLGGQKKPRAFTGPVKGHYLVAVAPEGKGGVAHDGHFHLTYLIDNSGRRWRERIGAALKVYDAAYTPDGKQLIVNSDDLLLCLDAATGREIWRSEKSPGRFNSNYYSGSLTVSPDGRLVAAGSEWQREPSWKGCVRLFDAENGTERVKLATPYHSIHAAAFSPDGRFLIAASTPYAYASHMPAEEARRVVVSLWEVASGTEIRRFRGHKSLVTALAFAPDSRTFYSASADGTVLQWDAFGLDDAAAVKPEQIDTLWNDLASDDAAKAYQAVARLVASPGPACAFLDRHLKAVPGVSAERLASLVRDLDSEQFAARESATRELRALGEQADGILRETLRNRPSLEVRRRIEALLEERRAHPCPPEELRRRRAVLVLEWIGSAEARRILKKVAEGSPSLSDVREARAALQRLQREPSSRSP